MEMYSVFNLATVQTRLATQFLFSTRAHISLSLSLHLLRFCSAHAHTSLSLSLHLLRFCSAHAHTPLSLHLLSFCSAQAHTSLSLSLHLLSFCSAHAHTYLSLCICSVSVQHARTHISLSASAQFLFSTSTHISLSLSASAQFLFSTRTHISLSLSASAQFLFSVRQRRAELNSVRHRYYVACFSNFICKYRQNHSTAIVIILCVLYLIRQRLDYKDLCRLTYCKVELVMYIYAFSRCFYPKRLTVHSVHFLSVCVFPRIEPTTFALLTQCSYHWATETL